MVKQSINPRTYKQTDTPTIVQGGGGWMDPPRSFRYIEA